MERIGQLPSSAQAIDGPSIDRHFGGRQDLLAMWIAEPYIGLAPAIVEALETRASAAWYGYETRPAGVQDAFWAWMLARHGWSCSDLHTLVSPSVGTSIGVLTDLVSDPDDGVMIQPPVFTDFKALVRANERTVMPNPLQLTEAGYRLDLEHLEATASDPAATTLILCNPHNPVGRVWTATELDQVAEICARHDVFVIADEIHADLVLEPHTFTPFATAAAEAGTRFAALHGPIKTFGLAGVCDTLVITDDADLADRFETISSRFHLTRNNVFGLAAAHVAYTQAEPWVDQLLELTAANAATLAAELPDPIRLVELQGTYLAWLDFRGLGMDVPELADWLAQSAGLALSPGHWFGRQGAGFARMTIATTPDQIAEAATRLRRAIAAKN